MLIRMIANVGKWDGSKPVHREDATIWGDAVTDLKTTSNRLSVWLGNNTEDIDDAIVALALCRDTIQKMFYMVLDETVLKSMEIELEEELGVVPGLDKAILKKHRDLVELDIKRLGMLSEYMIGLAKTPEFAGWLKTEDEIKKLLERYKNEGKIIPSRVRARLKEALKW